MNSARAIFRFARYVLRQPRLIVYATILVAFFLRVYRLADQNVWWDEGWSVWLSQKDIAWIAWRTAMDEHPPLHYWLLHFWNFVAGTDAFAGRFVSVAFGVLTIALIYRIGKKVGGTWIGVLAALFLATARFHIWWSQDIKNYTPSIFFVFAAVWFALDFRFQISDFRLIRPVRNSIIGYTIFAALAMWTHYLAALVLLALNLYILITIIASRAQIENQKPKIQNWLVANTLAAALFAPWFYVYLQNAATWSAAPTFDFTIFLKLVATVLPLGITTNIDDYAALTIALTTLAALGSLGIFIRRNYERFARITNYELLFALIVVFPPLLVYALSLTPAAFFAPKIQARYLLTIVPAYTVLLAFGISFLSRFSRNLAVFAILVVLGANAFVLNDYYAHRRLRDEYTTLANTINSFARQGDLVLLDTDQEWPTLLYYLRYPLDWIGASNGKPMSEAEADVIARRALNRADAIWVVAIPDALATDPQKLLEVRLARDLPKRFDQTFYDKRLVLYARDERDLIQVAPENFRPQYTRNLELNNEQVLLGFDLPVYEARAGDPILLTTYWNSTERSNGLQLVQSSGNPIYTSIFQVPAGHRVRVVTGVHLFSGDTHIIAIRLTTAEKTIELAHINVEPRAPLARGGSIAHPTSFHLGDAIHLAGFDLPKTYFRVGDEVPLVLYWRADQQIGKSYTVFVHLVGEQINPIQNNPLWGQVDRVPRSGTMPTTAWRINEVVQDPYSVRINPSAPSGKYKIEIGLYDPATGVRLATDEGDSIVIAEIQITNNQ